MAHIVVTIGTALAIMTASAAAQQSSDPRVSDLVQSGTLRAGLFLTQFYKDATTSEPKSVWVETARALAQRIGVRAQIVEHPTPEGEHFWLRRCAIFERANKWRPRAGCRPRWTRASRWRGGAPARGV